MIECFERFGDRMDWAMIILNPFEPWPGQHVLGAAEKNGVDILARVVDYGGLFHDDVKPATNSAMATTARIVRATGSSTVSRNSKKCGPMPKSTA
jgi:hypothetical protein